MQRWFFYYLDDTMQQCSRVYISYSYGAVFLKSNGTKMHIQSKPVYFYCQEQLWPGIRHKGWRAWYKRPEKVSKLQYNSIPRNDVVTRKHNTCIEVCPTWHSWVVHEIKTISAVQYSLSVHLGVISMASIHSPLCPKSNSPHGTQSLTFQSMWHFSFCKSPIKIPIKNPINKENISSHHKIVSALFNLSLNLHVFLSATV